MKEAEIINLEWKGMGTIKKRKNKRIRTKKMKIMLMRCTVD